MKTTVDKGCAGVVQWDGTVGVKTSLSLPTAGVKTQLSLPTMGVKPSLSLTEPAVATQEPQLLKVHSKTNPSEK